MSQDNEQNATNNPTLIWIDCEMTGLNPDSEKILEIAVILTDYSLDNTIEGPSLAIKVDDELIKNMDDWNTRTHTESGLLDLCQNGISIQEAEKEIIEFVEKYHDKINQKLILAGNSVWHDLIFLKKEMPTLCASHIMPAPIMDVTSISLNEKMTNPDFTPFIKRRTHRAMDDIKESIGELRDLRDFEWIDLD